MLHAWLVTAGVTAYLGVGAYRSVARYVDVANAGKRWTTANRVTAAIDLVAWPVVMTIGYTLIAATMVGIAVGIIVLPSSIRASAPRGT